MAHRLTLDRRNAIVKEWDNRLTPLEIAAALENDAKLPFTVAPLLRNGQRPVGYFQDIWTEDASYYTSRKGAKRLIVGFTGRTFRLGMPISYFLQMLRDDEFDVIILRDPRELHYTHGIRGLGDFVESMTQIRKFSDLNGFEQVITFGTSGGGFAALRAGALLGARRCFSLGGRYPWHPGRLIRGDTPVHAFDNLCACSSVSHTEFVSVYGSGNEIDTLANAQLRKTLPQCIEVPIDTSEHPPIRHFYRTDLLPIFLACLLDYWDEAEVRKDLLARLELIARHSDARASASALNLKLERDARRLAKNELRGTARRLKQERDSRMVAEKEGGRLLRRIDALHQSYSWRVTWPLRVVARLLRRKPHCARSETRTPRAHS